MATGGVDTNILSDETFDLLCTVCKNRGKNKEAEKYCTDCQDYYCLTCVKVHEDVPLLRGHKILDKGHYQPGSSKPLPVVPTERCDMHGHKPVDMYCQNHDDVGCAACMAVEHKPCQDIFYIPEYIQKKVSASKSQDMHATLESLETKLKATICNFQQEKLNILKRKAESIETIRKFRKEINQRLDEIEQNSITEIEDKYKVIIQKIEEDITALQDTKTDLTSAKDKVASAGSNTSQMFVSTKKGQAAASKAEKCLDERQAKKQNEDIQFSADEKLQAVLEELNTLGKATILLRYDLLHAKGMKKYTVKISSDTKDCDIFSSCFLQDGKIVLADYRNKKLKCLDKYNYSVKCHYDLPWTPWQVCPVNNLEVAVSSTTKQEVLLITVGNKMIQKSLMKLDFDCYGLAYNGGNLYISDRYTAVYIYSMSGDKLKQFSLVQSNPINYSVHGLAVSNDGCKVYAAVYGNGLTILNTDGQIVKHYNGPELKTARDCHVTGSGSVLVCGYRSNNILQFTPDGKLQGEVLKSDNENCKTVCCNVQMTKIIVGGERNEIEVYYLV